MKDDGNRVRANFTFGREETSAIAAAVKKQQEWETVIAEWQERRKVLEEKLPEFDWSKPVWNDSPPVSRIVRQLMEKYEAILEERQKCIEEEDRESLKLISRRSPHLLIDEQPATSALTIEQAKEQFLSARRKRVGLV